MLLCFADAATTPILSVKKEVTAPMKGRTSFQGEKHSRVTRRKVCVFVQGSVRNRTTERG